MKPIFMTGLLAVGLLAQTAAEKTFGEAQHKEDVSGDLAGAVAGYKRAIGQAGTDRALAARAQLRLGLALEKLGDANARAAYETLLRNFGDQKEEAERARTRLAALATPRAAGGAAQRTLLREHVGIGEPSVSGRYLPYQKSGTLFVYDRTAGTHREVGPRVRTNSEMIWASVVSPDEKWIAYGFVDWAKGGELRVVGIDGRGDRLLRREDNFQSASPMGWSPDGKTVLAEVYERGARSASLYFLDAGTGETKRKVDELPRFSAAEWSPDGKWVVISIRDPQQNGALRILRVDGGAITELLGGGDRKVVVGWMGDGRVLYTSDISGSRDLFAVEVRDGRVMGEPVKVRKGLAMYDGIHASRNGRLYGFSQGWMEEILEAEIDGARGVVAKPATAVPTRSQAYSRGGDYSPDGKFLVYVSGLTESEAAIYVREVASGSLRRYNAPPLTRMAKWYPDGRALVVWTAGQRAEDRNLYRLELATGELKKIPAAAVLMDAATNPTISPDGRFLYYKGGAPVGGGRAVRRIDLTTGVETIVTQGGIRMFALSPDGKEMLYSRRDARNRDSLAIAPVDGGAERTVYSYPEGHLSRAFGGMWWMADGKGILFHFGTGERADALWSLRLDGSAPRKLLEGGTIRAGDAHPDGRRHVWHAVRYQPELWTIDDAVR